MPVGCYQGPVLVLLEHNFDRERKVNKPVGLPHVLLCQVLRHAGLYATKQMSLGDEKAHGQASWVHIQFCCGTRVSLPSTNAMNAKYINLLRQWSQCLTMPSQLLLQLHARFSRAKAVIGLKMTKVRVNLWFFSYD